MTTPAQIIRRRRNRKQRRLYRQTQRQTWLGVIAVILTVFIGLPFSAILGGTALIYAQESATLPEPADTLDVSAVIGATRLYDRSGQTLLFAVQDPLGEDREWIDLEDLPRYLIDATLLNEDPTYPISAQFDPFSVGTRLWRNLFSGPISADTSLTGRLVRNAIAPTSEFSDVEDRTREIILTAEINRRYSADAILEWHLNTNFYGNEAYGIDAAARVYLGKRARDLTLDEAALLASIPTASQFNPIDDEIASRGRQADTLRRMLAVGLIAQADFDRAIATLTPLLPNAGQTPSIAPDFSLYARQQAEIILDGIGLNGGQLVSRGGLTITTTLDLDLYYQAECALRTHLARLEGLDPTFTTLDDAPCLTADQLPTADPLADLSPDQGSITVIEVATGEIKALIGPAHRAIYQPGPTLYPFVYFEGFRQPIQGTIFTPASMLLDIPRNFPGQSESLIYPPSNPDGRFRGPLSLREAVGRGLLVPAVQVVNQHGFSAILQSAHRIGLNSLDAGVYHLSLLERGGEAALLDVSYAYSVFASLGEMRGVVVPPRDVGFRNRDPVAILQIADADGTILWSYDGGVTTASNIFRDYPELGYLVNNVFADPRYRVEQFGPNAPLTLSNDRLAAVVNGLTGDQVDNWTVGYTPQYVIGVHLGRTDFAPMGLSGYALNGSAPIWKAVTEYLHTRDAIVPTRWTRPASVITLEVCERSGLLPNGVCPTVQEVFINGIVPTAADSYWQGFEVNVQTGLRAVATTPETLIVRETYFVPPDQALEWWRANRLPLPPTEFDTIYRDQDLFGATAITAPTPYADVQGVIELRGNVNTENMQFYRLAYGEGINPTAWTEIGEPQTEFTAGSILGLWDTGGLSGLYTLELTVVRRDNSRQRAAVQVRIDNQPPVITLTAGGGEAGRIFRFPVDRVIPLVADVQDNFSIDRVEFYYNDQLLNIDSEAPFSFDFAIQGIGVGRYQAIAYDSAGNRQTSAEITVEVRR